MMKRNFVILTFIMVFAIVVVPASAQERDPRDRELTFDDFSLTFHRTLVRNVNITEYAGDPPTNGPGFSDAPHIEIALYNETNLPESLFDTLVRIRVYSVNDLQDYPFLVEQAEALHSLLEERPELERFHAVDENGVLAELLPYIPTLPHPQVLRARAQYVETDEVSGVTYISYSNATPEPFLSYHFTYTFQGLSADGQYYISASMPLETNLFPSEPDASFDPEAFAEAWPQYLTDSIATLDAAAPEDFEPALGVLDRLIETVTFAD
jgi:hypothetical protein